MADKSLPFRRRGRSIILGVLWVFLICGAPGAFAVEDYDFTDEDPGQESWDHSYVDPVPVSEIIARDKSIPLPEVLRKLSIPTGPFLPEEEGEDTYRVVEGDMELPINEWTSNYLAYYAYSSSRTFKNLHKRSGLYESLIMDEIRKRNMPRELIWLCAVESAFNPRAYSPARAAGLWQFIPGTGRRYGMDITYWMDERLDPEKSTKAAMSYLSDLYIMFDDWHLAMASYNCGEGLVEKKLRRTNCGDFWCVADDLPRETRNYVPNILALAIIGHNPERYGFDHLTKLPSLNYSTVTVDDATDLRTVALCAGTDKDEIQRLNPSLLRFCTPPGERGFKVNIPWGRTEQFNRSYSRLSKEERYAFKRHTVEAGQTLYSIAAGYGTSEKLLASVNNLSPGASLREGQTIYVPVPKDTRFDPSRKRPASIPDSYRTAPSDPDDRPEPRKVDKGAKKGRQTRKHEEPKKFIYKVEPGDTLWNIAIAYNCSVEDLKKWNPGVSESNIYPGDAILIYRRGGEKKKPADDDRDEPKSSKKPKTHSVKKGDTCGHLAIEYGITTKDIIAWNDLDSNCNIREGQTIYISKPKSGGSSSSGKSSGGSKPEGYRGKSIRYKVKAGETLWSIAKKHDVHVSEIVAWNGLDSETVREGQVLTIKPGPGYYNKGSGGSSGGSSGPAKSSGGKSGQSGGKVVYTVKEGDSLWDIAKKHGVRVADIQKWNGLDSDDPIRPGQRLVIYPGKSSGTGSAKSSEKSDGKKNTSDKKENSGDSANKDVGPRGKAVTYTVKEGDSLWGIAKKFDVYAWEIKKDNNLTSDTVKPGQKLKIRPGPGYKK